MTYSLATDPNARVYKPTFVNNYHHHARQQSLSNSGRRMSVGNGGLMPGVGEGGGVREFSLQFRMVIKIDAGISKYVSQIGRLQPVEVGSGSGLDSDDH
jgi:hypothetical protein